MNLFFKKNKNGFTLIELIVSISIFVVILSMVMVNYRQGENFNTFRLQSFNLEDAIKSVQNMALTGREISGIIPRAYGIFFNKNENNFIIYGDVNGNYIFDESIDLIYSEEFLDKNINFVRYTSSCNELSMANNLDIAFIPPQPMAIINNDSTCSSSVIFINSNNVSGEWAIYFDVVTGRVWAEFSQ